MKHSELTFYHAEKVFVNKSKKINILTLYNKMELGTLTKSIFPLNTFSEQDMYLIKYMSNIDANMHLYQICFIFGSNNGLNMQKRQK